MGYRSGNPVLSEKTFESYRSGTATSVAGDRAMTLEGTVNKTGILLLLAVIAASFTWTQVLTPGGIENAAPIALGSVIGAFIVSLVTIFKPSVSRFTAPLYAVLEGLALGAISALFNLRYHGIATQAVALTFGTLGVMLLAYRSGLVRATEKFKLGVFAATGGLAVFMLVAMGLSLFHVSGPANMLWYSHSPLAILISLGIVVIAALNLVLDFDLIERGVAYRAPAYMEWYGAFSLMVTLVWLYVRFLRLLAQLNSSRR